MNFYGVFILGVNMKYGLSFCFFGAVKWPIPVKGLMCTF